MIQYNINKNILPIRFIDILCILCSGEFLIRFINYQQLLKYIGDCKKANLFSEIVGNISVLENGYSPELVDAINSARLKQKLTICSGYIEILDMDKEVRKRIIEQDIEDIDFMRSFLDSYFNQVQGEKLGARFEMERFINDGRIKEVPR